MFLIGSIVDNKYEFKTYMIFDLECKWHYDFRLIVSIL